jgi:hypothetical protein
MTHKIEVRDLYIGWDTVQIQYCSICKAEGPELEEKECLQKNDRSKERAVWSVDAPPQMRSIFAGEF